MKAGLISGIAVLALAAATDARAARYVIEIKNMAFGAAPAHPQVGDTVVWTNKDIFRRTATAMTKTFDLDLPPGASASVVLDAAGALDVTCRFHPNMKIHLNVEKK